MTVVTRVSETDKFITDQGVIVKDEIQNIFLQLCFEKYSDAKYIYMIKRDMGMVFSESDEANLYCLSIGESGFELFRCCEKKKYQTLHNHLKELQKHLKVEMRQN